VLSILISSDNISESYTTACSGSLSAEGASLGIGMLTITEVPDPFGSRELYTSGLSNDSSTERAKGKNRTPLSGVGGDRTFGNYDRLLG
jgi:hypothetical protein